MRTDYIINKMLHELTLAKIDFEYKNYKKNRG